MLAALQIAASTAGALLAIVTAIRLLRPIRVWFRRLGEFLDDWQGDQGRPGVAARPGVMVRLDALEKITRQTNGQVHSNGGDSLRDGVAAIKQAVTGEGLAPAPADRPEGEQS